MSVKINALTKIYGTQKALDHLTFEAKKGEITGFLGPNGAGKSTTMKIATGFIQPSEGDIFVNDVSVEKNPFEVKKMVGYLPEHNPLYLEMYVKEFLLFIAKIYGIPSNKRKQKIDDIISLVKLNVEAHKKIRMLSKGYRQRVGLAKALISDPSVLILDEPTSGLDPNQIVEIREAIKLVKNEKTIILSTHIMQEVEAICDKVVIINKGKLLANSNLKDLKNKYSQNIQFIVTFDTDIDISIFQNLTSIININKSDAKTFIFDAKSIDARNEILKLTTDNNLPLSSIKQAESSLEEVFKQLTQNNN